MGGDGRDYECLSARHLTVFKPPHPSFCCACGIVQLSAGDLTRFLLGTGRMPHPVGWAMGVTCVTAEKREYPALNRLIKYS